jgi:nicotinate-nucleotide adenylyltransferase
LNIALFGGTFDPIHAGHLRAAQAAAKRFRLDRILFIPSGVPPHKIGNHLTAFEHRSNMVALACSGEPRFVPSLLEAPGAEGQPQYSISTVRKVRRALRSRDQLYFLIGVDAFLDLPHWKSSRQLLALVNFIVVSRPGYDNQEISRIVPPDLVRQGTQSREADTIRLRHSAVHILQGVDMPVASSDIRDAVRAGRHVTGLVPPLVEEYILKEGLYLPARKAARA